MKKLTGLACAPFVFCFLVAASASQDSDTCVITIKSVELKNSAGEWLTVIEPDKRVDLAKEEPGLSFFNNGRVPAGEYVNFRLTLVHSAIKEISGSQDFQKPLFLKKGSFVGVWFSLGLEKAVQVCGLSVTVDEDTRNLGTADVQVQSGEVQPSPSF